ncbi:MAG: protein kinase [Acidimicrobiales bacterium]|jgi:serine/threonine protein kinase
MSPRREPAPPPDLPGHSYVQLLGSGGFADVYLFERELPKMPVAVKVLVGGVLTKEDERRFTAEANTMARFSGHPYIVGVLNADVSSDGRPYIVMQYYPKDNLAVRSRRSLLTVAETLQISIQVASAVETAHRAGVIHRDIKPANVLTGEFGEPGLTDFGIAGATGAAAGDGASEGLSIPWAPPEAFDSDSVLDERSDVYSLGATVFNLLTGRSPFEVPGESNRALDLMDRIERMPVPAIGRGDVPDSLVRVLRQAMAKDPEQRHQTAMAFARDLQGVEQELRLKMTSVVVPDDPADASVHSPDDEAEETRGRMPQRISPQATTDTDQRTRPPSARPVDRSQPSDPVGGGGNSELATRGRPQSEPRGSAATPLLGALPIAGVPMPGGNRATVDDATGTRKRPIASAPAPAPDESDGTPTEAGPAWTRGRVVGAVLVGVVVAVVAGSLALSSHGAPPAKASSTTTTTAPLGTSIPATPTFTASVANGTATVTWSNPDPQAGDTYNVVVQGQEPQQASSSPYSVPWTTGTQFCVYVQTVNSQGTPSTNTSYQCVG